MFPSRAQYFAVCCEGVFVGGGGVAWWERAPQQERGVFVVYRGLAPRVLSRPLLFVGAFLYGISPGQKKNPVVLGPEKPVAMSELALYFRLPLWVFYRACFAFSVCHFCGLL